jgi:hypothetical protein
MIVSSCAVDGSKSSYAMVEEVLVLQSKLDNILKTCFFNQVMVMVMIVIVMVMVMIVMIVIKVIIIMMMIMTMMLMIMIMMPCI